MLKKFCPNVCFVALVEQVFLKVIPKYWTLIFGDWKLKFYVHNTKIIKLIDWLIVMNIMSTFLEDSQWTELAGLLSVPATREQRIFIMYINRSYMTATNREDDIFTFSGHCWSWLICYLQEKYSSTAVQQYSSTSMHCHVATYLITLWGNVSSVLYIPHTVILFSTYRKFSFVFFPFFFLRVQWWQIFIQRAKRWLFALRYYILSLNNFDLA